MQLDFEKNPSAEARGLDVSFTGHFFVYFKSYHLFCYSFFSLYATLRGHLRQLRYDVVHTDSRYQLTLDLKIGLQSSALYHRMSLFHKILLPRKNVFCLYTQGMQVQSHNLNGMAGSNQGTQFVRALFREVTIEQLEFYHIPLVRKRLDGGK